MSDLTPSYYLAHETPAGHRYAYPAPTVPDAPNTGEATWSSPDGPVEHIPPSSHGWSSPKAGWLISDRPLTSAVLRWTVAAGHGPWHKRTEPLNDDTLVLAARRTAPDEPDAASLAHLAGHDDDRDCLSCDVAHALYTRVPLPREPRGHVIDLAGWVPLPGEADPDPSREWTVNDKSPLAVYGRHTAHLWPGTLGGFRAAVVAILKEHPLITGDPVAKVYDFDSSAEVSVHWRVRWDLPRPRKRREGERKRKAPYTTDIAMGQHTSLVVPDELAAATKAAAIAEWDDAARDWAGRFLPDVGSTMRACSSCNGRGYHLGGAS